jgi:hypothetical protein
MAKGFDAIVSDIINNILIVSPTADIKVGEVIRDVFIDIQALQIETLYGIVDASSRAQSVLTARSQQLDRLGYNFNVSRNGATPASTNVIVSIRAGVTAPTPCNVGDQFYTQADQNNAIQTFVNTQLTLLQTGQTQVSLPVVNINPGSAGNVAANTITQSSYSFADEVYNPNPATGGTDIESDASFAIRIPLAAGGKYLNTYKGIAQAIQGVTDINGQPFIVTPDNPLSRGMYTTDVYLQRNANYYGTTAVETAPANTQYYVFQNQPLYNLNPINSVSVYDAATSTFTTIPEVNPNTATTNFVIEDDPSDALGYYINSTEGAKRLLWLIPPPTVPYSVSYNYDHTIIDSQNLYNLNDEITNDLLFKAAPAIPLYVSAALTAAQGVDTTSTFANAQDNLINLFDGLSTGQALTETDAVFAFLQDSNLTDAFLTNFDSTIKIDIPVNNNPPDAQSQITPFGFYFETDVVTPYLYYPIAARLWIGKQDVITTSNFVSGAGFNLQQPSQYSGVTDSRIIRAYTTSWATNIYPFYDELNQTLILNFGTAPPDNNQTITLNLVQVNISTLAALNYLTIGPSIVSSVQVYASTVNNAVPQYATIVPNGITFAQCNLYQNSVQLVQGSSTTVGDYNIIYGPDNSGIVGLTFTTQPATSDILQFGLLNPDLSISYSTDSFTQ